MYCKKLLVAGIIIAFSASCTNSSTTNHQNGTADSTAVNNPVAELEKTIGTDTLVADSLREGLVEKLVETNQVDKAVAQIDLLLKKQPRNPAYLFMKADALERKGDTANAIVLFEESVIAAGSFTDAELRLANLYAETGNPNTIKLCDRLLKQASAIKFRSDILHMKGIYYTHVKNPAAALRLFNQIIKEDYSYMDAYIEKGLVYYDDGKYADAWKVFHKSTEVKNSFADGYFWMAKAEEKLSRKEDAINNFKRSLALDQSIEEAREGLKRLGALK